MNVDELPLYRYLQQDKVWVPQSLRAMQIAEMDPGWRWNAARWLERHAAHLAFYADLDAIGRTFDYHEIGAVHTGPDDPDRAARCQNPQNWIRRTPLHRALLAGLPPDTRKLAQHNRACQYRVSNGTDRCTCHQTNRNAEIAT